MLTKLYRKHISKETRQKIYDLFLRDTLRCFRSIISIIKNPKLYKKWLSYKFYFLFNKPKTELEQAQYEWSKKGISMYPYLWEKEYLKINYEVFTDETNGLRYVWHNNKKLYFKRSYDDYGMGIYRSLLIEQDSRSAHKYVDNYEELKGKSLLDIGSAEGIFALDTIESVEHAYLFECEEEWIEALEATFAPWKDKVSIIRRYVNDFTDENNITIDDFISQNNIDNIFIKMDIEGFERKALAGSKKTFASDKNIEGAVCVYHLPDDIDFIKGYLVENNCKTTITKGYLYMAYEFRKGVIRFKKH